MSENQDPTSLSAPNSVAARLKAAGFKQTGIAQAVWEYIESLFWARSNIGANLMWVIWNTNAEHLAVLGKKEVPVSPRIVWDTSIQAANDDRVKKAA